MSKIFGCSYIEDPIDYLAEQIIRKHDDIFIANKTIVILPSRRAARNLKSKLLHYTKDKVCFLPRIITYSDIPENLILFNACCEELNLSLPSVIDNFTSELIVIEIIEDIKNKYPSFKTFKDKKISGYIKKFLIKFFTYNSYSPYPIVENPDYQIFNYLVESFTEKLKTLNKVTEQQLRNIAVSQLEKAWYAKNGYPHIYAVAPPSNIPYVLRFLKLINSSPNSEIIIHGFDFTITHNEWDTLNEKHAQYYIKYLLSYLSINSLELYRLPQNIQPASPITLIETQNEIEEAKQIALCVIDHLQSGMDKIAIITDNRTTAKLIKEYLKIYNININDTVAKNSLNLNEIKFFLLIFEFANAYNLDKINLLSFLKNPLLALDKKEIEDFEIRYIRKPKNYKSVNEIIEEIQNQEAYKAILSTLKTVRSFRYKFSTSKSFQNYLYEHIKYFNALVTSETVHSLPGVAYLNSFIIELSNLPYASKVISLKLYKELLLKILSEQTYRDEEFIETVQLMTPLEARLQKFDLVIIPSLNEGNFPIITKDWPLIEPSIAKSLNFPNYQESFGYGAYDFLSLINNKKVVLSRSLHSFGRETIESRFLSSIKITHKLEDIYYKAHTDLEKTEYNPAPRPNPIPPLAARPRKFSVSAIERLIYNPYVYYAKYILKLTPLDGIDITFSKKDFGIYLHKVLSEIFEGRQYAGAQEFTECLITKFKEYAHANGCAQNNTLAFWLPRIERIAPWLYEYEQSIAFNCARNLTEAKREILLNINQEAVILSAIFDRILLYHDGTAKIIDYKTGYTPMQKDVDQGLSPQFPIENLILSQKIGSHNITQEYIELKGKKDIANVKPITINTEITMEELTKLLEMFLNPNQGYFASMNLEKHQRFKDYHHLISLNLT